MITSDHDLNREKRIQERIYYTIVLSDVRIEDGLDYRCYKCGRLTLTIFNEPKAGVMVRIPFDDIPKDARVAEALCKNCNIMYRTV